MRCFACGRFEAGCRVGVQAIVVDAPVEERRRSRGDNVRRSGGDVVMQVARKVKQLRFASPSRGMNASVFSLTRPVPPIVTTPWSTNSSSTARGRTSRVTEATKPSKDGSGPVRESWSGWRAGARVGR